MRPQTYEPGEVGATTTGSLNGSITDQNGASVAGANVVITNIMTNQSFETTTNSQGLYSAKDLAPGKYKLSVSARGFKDTVVNDLSVQEGLRTNFNMGLDVGNVSETVTISGTNATVGTSLNFRQLQELPLSGRSAFNLFALTPGAAKHHEPISNLVASGQSGVEAQTSAAEVGDLFEYRIEQPVTVPRDRSALIPILQTRMEGERVSIFNEQSPANRPMSGMLLKNTSSLTLDDGSLTVIDGDAYAGEALMERLKPAEERLISFALDLGTLVNVTDDEDRRPAYMLKVHDGVAAAYYFNVRRKIYTIVNQTDQPRVVYIEHPIDKSASWQLSDETAKPDLKTAKHYRFRVSVGPHQKLEFPVAERSDNYDSFALTDFTRAQLDFFISRRYIDDQTRQALEKIIDLKSQITNIETQLQETNRQAAEISQDQQRLRENIKILTSTSEAKQLITRYVAKANDQETRLEQIEKDRRRLSEERLRLNAELNAMIRGLSLDRKID